MKQLYVWEIQMHFCGSVEALELSSESICSSDLPRLIGYPATNLLINLQILVSIHFRGQYSFAS